MMSYIQQLLKLVQQRNLGRIQILQIIFVTSGKVTLKAPLKYFGSPSQPVFPAMVADPRGSSRLRHVINEHTAE